MKFISSLFVAAFVSLTVSPINVFSAASDVLPNISAATNGVPSVGVWDAYKQMQSDAQNPFKVRTAGVVGSGNITAASYNQTVDQIYIREYMIINIASYPNYNANNLRNEKSTLVSISRGYISTLNSMNCNDASPTPACGRVGGGGGSPAQPSAQPQTNTTSSQTRVADAQRALADAGCPATAPSSGQDVGNNGTNCAPLRTALAAAQTEQTTKPNSNSTDSNGCSWTNFGSWFTSCIYEGLLWFFSAIVISIGGSILYFAGLIFDFSLWFSIIKFPDLVRSATGTADPNGLGNSVYQTWALIRNLFNIIIVFQLLKLAIFKIVGNVINTGSSRKVKQTLMSIIIFTLFVNFSFFFTKALIDVSNIATLQFYAGLGASGASSDSNTFSRGNVGIAIIEGLGIHSAIFNSGSAANDGNGFDCAENKESEACKSLLGVHKDQGVPSKGFENSFFGNILLFCLMLLAAFILIQGASIFIGRTIYLLILIVLSPLMFAKGIVGFVDKWSDEWWKMLLEQLYVSPLYMGMLFITLKMAGGKDTGGILSVFNDQGLQGAFTNTSGYFGSMALMVVQAAIVAGLFAACVSVAKNFASSSASKSMAFGNKVFGNGVGWAGRNSVGRLANRVRNSERLQRWGSNAGVGGAAARRMLTLADKGKDASFDYRNAKSLQQLAKRTGTDFNLGKGVTGGFKSQRDAADKRKADNLVTQQNLLGRDTYGLTGDAKKAVEESNKNMKARYVALKSIDSNTTDEAIEKMKVDTKGLSGDDLVAAENFNQALKQAALAHKNSTATRISTLASGARRGVTGVRSSAEVAKGSVDDTLKALAKEKKKKATEKHTKKINEILEEFSEDNDELRSASEINIAIDGELATLDENIRKINGKIASGSGTDEDRKELEDQTKRIQSLKQAKSRSSSWVKNRDGNMWKGDDSKKGGDKADKGEEKK